MTTQQCSTAQQRSAAQHNNATTQHIVPTRCCYSKTARSLFRVGVLCSAASSCRHRWLKPVRIWAPEREVTYQNSAPAFPIGVPTLPLLAVLTGCCNSRTARTLRRVSALCPAASSCRNRGSNRGFSRLGWSAEPTLLSLSWYKPWLVVDVVGGGGAFLLSTGR